MRENKASGLDRVAVFYSFRPQLMNAPVKIESEQTADSVTLVWLKTDGVTGYRVYVKNGNDWKTVKTLKENTYTITGLDSSTKYTFAVKSYISTGSFVLWSPEYISIDVKTKVEKPAKITATQTSDTVTLSWNKVTGAVGYRIYRYNSKTKKWSSLKTTTGTSYKVVKLKPGTVYKFRIRAYSKDNGTVWGDYSDVLTIATKPATPKVSATQTTSYITLKWKKVTGADGYRVYKYNSKTKKYEKLKDVTGTSIKISKLKSGTAYKYKVRAYIKADHTVWGEYSKELNTATKCKTPTLKVASTKKGVASASWTNVAGETGYELYGSSKKSSGFKLIATTKANIVKASKKKLTSKKTYYFKVRAYKTVDGKKIYSDWSAVKSVKIK